jgi:hypothetical protein
LIRIGNGAEISPEENKAKGQESLDALKSLFG